jgi:hypothetical protein
VTEILDFIVSEIWVKSGSSIFWLCKLKQLLNLSGFSFLIYEVELIVLTSWTLFWIEAEKSFQHSVILLWISAAVIIIMCITGPHIVGSEPNTFSFRLVSFPSHQISLPQSQGLSPEHKDEMQEVKTLVGQSHRGL